MKYCIAALLALRSVEVGQESPALSLTTHIPLPNVKGPIDHASVDLKGQRLFVAAVANDTREVIDLKSSQRVQTITDLRSRRPCTIDAYQSPLCSLRLGTAPQKCMTGPRSR